MAATDPSSELSTYLHDPTAGEVWEEPTSEMLWWTRRFGFVLAPPPGRETWLREAVAVVAVTPSAHVANLSLHFQSFLFDVFHQTKTSRIAHFLCMPLINMMTLVMLAQISWGGGGWLRPTGALVGASVLCVWYVAQATHNRVPLLGLVMIPVTLLTYVGAMAYWDAFALPAAARTWYTPTAPATSPLVWIAGLSLVQAASHGPEPKLPPRVTGTPHWMTLRDFLLGAPGQRHGPLEIGWRLLRSGAQIVFGALDELWACWRLIPLNFLEIMWRLGYKPQMYAQWKSLSSEAIEHGDPAIDFIGVGGGARIRDPAAIPGTDRAKPAAV